jgi:hypothetical protein
MMGRMAGLVSIVMPCFNAGPMLPRALASVQAQTYRDLEIVFVDNNSTDGSLDRAREIAKGDPRFVIAQCPAQGANHARNHGYALAQGRYIQWLDADDELEPRKIELQAAALDRGEDDIAYCAWVRHDHLRRTADPDHPAAMKQVDDQILRTLSGVWYPPHSYLLRRAAAERLQREEAWWPGRLISDDYEYYSVAALLGLRFRFVAGARVITNQWSMTQKSVLPQTVPRARCIRDILAHLQRIAARPEIAPRLKPPHRALLFQNCDLWAMPSGSVRVARQDGRWCELTHAGTGARAKVRPREAALAQALQKFGAADILRFHVKMMCSVLPEFNDQHPLVSEILDGFCRDGLMQLVSRLDDAIAPEPAA